MAVLDFICILAFIASMRRYEFILGGPSGYRYDWAPSSVLIAIFFVLMNTGVVFVTLKDKNPNGKTNEQET